MIKDTRSPEELGRVFSEEYDSLRKKYRETFIVTASDQQATDHLLEIGQKLEQDPQPKDTLDAVRLFKEYYSFQEFIICKMLFNETIGVWNEQSIRSQLLKLEHFINRAKMLDYTDACYWINGATWQLNHLKDNIPTDEFLYSLWTVNGGDFFQNFKYPNLYAHTGSRHAQIYGKYVLFYDYLKNLSSAHTEEPLENTLDSPPRPRMNCLALAYCYLERNKEEQEIADKAITNKADAATLALKYGFTSKTSGQKLFGAITNYRESIRNRNITANPEDRRNYRVTKSLLEQSILLLGETKAKKEIEKDLDDFVAAYQHYDQK